MTEALTAAELAEIRGRLDAATPVPWFDARDIEVFRNCSLRLLAEVDRLRSQNTELHRRCQQAEAAVDRIVQKWQQHGGPRGGNFGRGVLAAENARLRDENERLARAVLGAMTHIGQEMEKGEST